LPQTDIERERGLTARTGKRFLQRTRAGRGFPQQTLARRGARIRLILWAV
jgi:hypothetical protein